MDLRPTGNHMTICAKRGGLQVVLRLAGCICAVVAIDTTAADRTVIEANVTPICGDVALRAILGRLNVIDRLASGGIPIVARGTCCGD